jgi:hypothetical protein
VNDATEMRDADGPLPARSLAHGTLTERRSPRVLSAADIGQLVSAEVQRVIGRQRNASPPPPPPAPAPTAPESEGVVVDRLVSVIAGRLRTLAREERFRSGRIR